MAEARELLLVAGEASGDLHGGALLQALRRRVPDLQVSGVGGVRLRAAGMELLADVSSLSAAGVVEILGSIRRHHRVMRLLKRHMDRRCPDLVVLIDYPGFNLMVAREAHRRGIPVFFYIAPQVWAWGRGRARRMAGFIDRLAVIFPFEEGLFNAHGRAFARYVGHPLLDEIQVTAAPAQTRRRHGLDPDRPLLVLMPGSRRSEIRLLLPPLLAAAERLRSQGWQVVLLRASTIDPTVLERAAGGGPLPIPCIADDTVNLLHAADAGLVSSGTATLQAALLGCPHVIVYRFNWLTYLLARLVTRHRLLGLPNVVLGRVVFPELLQERVNPAELVAALQCLLAERSRVEAAIADLRGRMGPPGASGRAADALLELLP
ncbi:lipid-A-disaccharide synthase [Cyanobium sp. ATX 6A2]|uniref:lipid-A-disaccharide synthase n=1 Tax=Cyanobium sp. ATX 6A2 TaxID=2823700 RepID=UPI0020CC2DF4|nr:lipid-A-disaccharide synthase [Cyanobium sp. ATX 6A2]MCP9888715.1 lipid-A-disaccharide synthase [Cyanobium sp. ATX 6A2]